MSDVQNTTAPASSEPVVDSAAPAVITDATAPAVDDVKVDGEAPKTEVSEGVADENKTEVAAPVEESKVDTEVAAEKPIEPLTEGQLAYKGPGLVKSLIPSKKEFWLSDEAVAPQNLDLFMRGEKPEISHAVVAWASQTGKGLLFFNKKNETDRTHPHDVLPLYDATDLKKSPPHEFSFKLHNKEHVFKAASDAERDGWYMSIEKAIELGKASKEEVRESEGYKAEMEKLNKPNTVLGAAAKRSQSQPKKSTDADKAVAERTGSTEEEKTEDKKQKSRSTSRGMLNRLKGKKEEVEQKTVEKKEEKEVEKENKKVDEEATPVAASTEAAPAVAAVSAAEIPAAAETLDTPASEEKEEKKVEEKAKPSKRGSIFGKVSSTWGSMKSPSKEKEQKDVELKPEDKEGVVSENPPVLPETATTEPVPEPVIPTVEEPVTDSKTEEKKDIPADAVSPGKEKSSFLSQFMKRTRSVSPSQVKKEEPVKKDEVAEAKPSEETPVVDEVKKDEPVAESSTEVAPSEIPAETPKAEASTTPNKRQSVLGSLGRRASKAIKGFNAPKKENATPATSEVKAEEASEAKPVEETPVVNGESKTEPAEAQQSIGDVVPDAVNVGQPQHTTPTVTASA